ncbi:MAG: RNA 2',3'-cyclic phosphodiesterase [Spirochaetia bacterium]|nr:RNA 2',3'-cyclic phosphodiesterase [Spirochaetia bacterium]
MRLFTAISIPVSIQEEIGNICYGIPNARWVKKEQLHITLCFIGEMEQHQLPSLTEVLSDVSFKSFNLNLKGIGQFLTAKDLNTIWLGVKDSDELTELQSRVSKKLKSIGINPDKKKYSPHVTLARIKKATGGRIREYMEEFSQFQTEIFPVHSFNLFSSSLYPGGPVHTLEKEFFFQSNNRS